MVAGLFANFDFCYFFGLFVSLIACFVGCLLSVLKFVFIILAAFLSRFSYFQLELLD